LCPRQSDAVKAYLIGGLSWFAIPFTLATTMGLAGRALMLDLPPEDVGAGLVLPKAAYELMGKGGAGAALLLVFMAVTSALSAELIAVSSVVTFDIYKCYFNPQATNKQIKAVADATIMMYGVFAGIMAIFLNGIGVNLVSPG
jgi:Na+/proline symporter